MRNFNLVWGQIKLKKKKTFKLWTVDRETGLDWLHLHTFLFVICGRVQCSRTIQNSSVNSLQNSSVNSLFSFPFHLFSPMTEIKRTTTFDKTGKPLRMILHFKSAALDFQWHIDDTLKKGIGFFWGEIYRYKYSNLVISTFFIWFCCW